MTDLVISDVRGDEAAHPPPRSRLAHLRGDGVSLVIDTATDPQGQGAPASMPQVLFWGADLGDLADLDPAEITAALSRQDAAGTLDAAWQVSLLPLEGEGWGGRPGLSASVGGIPVHPRWAHVACATDPDGRRFSVVADDVVNGLRVDSAVTIETGGIVTVTHTVTRTADDAGDLTIEWLEATLPTPKAVDHLTTFAGRWTREKVPTTSTIPRGATTRQTRRGRGGHDAPTLSIVSIDPPRDRSGELWAVHLGWSADCTYRNDRMPDSVDVLGAGELLRTGEIVLGAGESYATPTAYFAWSGAGLDGLSERFHRFERARPNHPRSPRPLVLNTWEAVYFDHDPAFLLTLAELAAKVGVERFVLDDGWFLGRRSDIRGLGDWFVDRAVWPDGLGPLADRVHELGMEFGLWFEPEMINLDSDLARRHPEWLLHPADHLPTPAHLSWRTQYVLDIAREDAYAYILGRLDALVTELGIDFIKWDHNRDLVEAVHDGRPGTHAQTRAVYRLMAELKSRHPRLEIESCSSGGARSDLGILEVADRVWASDSNDPIERQDIQRWTQLLLAPELVGGHVGPTTAHSSGRTTPLSFRLATSLMGSAGFEWNIAECTPEELEVITRWAALYKEVRSVIHTGTAVHADVRDPALRVVGAVAADRSEAVFTIASVATLEDSLPERIRLHGLGEDAIYDVRVRDEIGASRHGFATPAWLSSGTVALTGSFLGTVGLQIPPLWPTQAIVLHLTRR
ncbi:alpha-galactosidase [Microbacterium sp. SA39]|uniref:alpha-galactosidase n=1 Tax=Microbacterium sp. SA39 TaxID=1263625 RepID=UPI00061E9ED2|nr:alpha-galactosidase [Microbacterium sp. SA39]KJQ53932.1 Alpha-galactosidase [Microbacterium sp. SA39]